VPTIRFSQDDFLMGKVIRPAHYHAMIKSIVTKPAKSDGSAVYNINMKIVEPGDFKGVPITDWLSEKALGIGGRRLVRACNGGVEPKPEENYELNNGVGKIVKIHVSNGLYNGRVTNNVDDYDTADPSFTNEEE